MKTQDINELKPKALIADGPNHYRILFDKNGTEIAYKCTITVTDSGITLLEREDNFVAATLGNPKADILCQAILKFHNARQSG